MRRAGVESSRSRLLYTLLPGLVCFVAAVAAGRLLGPVMRLGERWTRRGSGCPPSRVPRPCPRPGPHGRDGRVPDRQHRARPVRGELPRDARGRRARRGGVRGAARLHALGGAGARPARSPRRPSRGTRGPRPARPPTRCCDGRRRCRGQAPRRSLRRCSGSRPRRSRGCTGAPTSRALSPGAIAKLVGAGGPVSLRGVPIPAGTGGRRARRPREGRAGADRPRRQDATGRLRNRAPRLAQAREPGTCRRRCRRRRGGCLAPASLEANQAHQLAHRQAGSAQHVQPDRLDDARIARDRRREGADRLEGFVTTSNGQLRHGRRALLTYAFTLDQSVVARLPQPTDGHPLPVIASAEHRRRGARRRPPHARLPGCPRAGSDRGSRDRFPDSQDLGQGFVVVDESHLATALGADAPGTSEPDELWVSGPVGRSDGPGAHAVRRARARPRAASIQSQLSSQPLARGITVTLGAAGLVALLLAAIGVWVTLVSDARDERGELFDLEAQGVPPGRPAQPAATALGRPARLRDPRRARARPRPLAPRRLRGVTSPPRRPRRPRPSSPTRRGARSRSLSACSRRSCSGSRS